MHRLLELEKDGILGNNPRGLVAWWTFEDGGGSATVADVTGNRFKSLLVRRQLPATRPTDAAAAAGGSSTNARAKSPPRTGTPGATGHTTAAQQGESYFTGEEGARYRIPEEALRLLPSPYWKALPPDCRPAPRAAWEQLEGDDDHLSGPASVEAPTAKGQANCPPPWEAWMKTFPRWSWLNAETLPTPQLPASVRMALGKVPPAVPSKPGKSAEQQTPQPPKAGGPEGRKDPAKSVHHSSRGVLPIPSLRAKGVCAYELRRHRLATKGRELQREVDCPLGESIVLAPTRPALTPRILLTHFCSKAAPKRSRRWMCASMCVSPACGAWCAAASTTARPPSRWRTGRRTSTATSASTCWRAAGCCPWRSCTLRCFPARCARRV